MDEETLVFTAPNYKITVKLQSVFFSISRFRGQSLAALIETCRHSPMAKSVAIQKANGCKNKFKGDQRGQRYQAIYLRASSETASYQADSDLQWPKVTPARGEWIGHRQLPVWAGQLHKMPVFLANQHVCKQSLSRSLRWEVTSACLANCSIFYLPFLHLGLDIHAV